MRSYTQSRQGAGLFQDRTNVDTVLNHALAPNQSVSVEETMRMLTSMHSNLHFLLMRVAVKIHGAAANWELHQTPADEQALQTLCGIAKQLVSAGANPDIADQHGRSAKFFMLFNLPEASTQKIQGYLNETPSPPAFAR